MKHLALYRKWRPQRFSDVVGQEHVSRTLLNAIRLDRLAHAYLFCGPRGTGKTSSARLLAKALNCENPQNEEPCNVCQSCEEITAGRSLDVIEIDAASNRGIDAARDLREQVRFSASAGRYRVFIIDEFHMLTKEAFNALLKTLEEPPEKVIFVLATTEPHEVLATIVSRCQRFDFQRIGVPDMRTYLRKIADQENIGISDTALDALSRKANGGLRDGMSLLDQVQAIGEPGEALPDPLVYVTLGLVQEDALIDLLSSAFRGDPETLIQNTRTLLEQGHDAMQLVQELIQLLRHLSLAHLPEDTLANLSVPGHLIAPLKALHRDVSRGDQVRALDLLLRTGDRLHRCSQPDIWLEADLLCLCLQSENALLKRVETLESRLREGGVPSVPQHSVSRAPKVPVTAPPEPQAPAAPPAPAVVASPPPPPADNEPNVSLENMPAPIEKASNPEDLPALWDAFLEAVKTHQKPVIGFLMNGELQRVDAENQLWFLAFKGRFQRDRIQKKLSDRTLQDLVSQIMGMPYNIEVFLAGESPSSPPASPVAETATATATSTTEKKKPEVAPPAPPVKREPVPEDSLNEQPFDAPSFDEEGDMVDMSYLPEASVAEPPPVSPSMIDALPVPSKEIAPLPPPVAPASSLAPTSIPTPTPEKSPSEQTSSPEQKSPHEQGAEDTLPIESLQEVADLFKGKIVARRNPASESSPSKT